MKKSLLIPLPAAKDCLILLPKRAVSQSGSFTFHFARTGTQLHLHRTMAANTTARKANFWVQHSSHRLKLLPKIRIQYLQVSELSTQLLWWAQDPEAVQGNHLPQTNDALKIKTKSHRIKLLTGGQQQAGYKLDYRIVKCNINCSLANGQRSSSPLFCALRKPQKSHPWKKNYTNSL